MTNLYCIGDELTVRGFRLAGVDGIAVGNPAEASAAVRTAVANPNCALIILTERIAAGIRAQLDNLRLERVRPVLVEIPDAGGPLPGHKGLHQVVQEAVGLRVI